MKFDQAAKAVKVRKCVRRTRLYQGARGDYGVLLSGRMMFVLTEWHDERECGINYVYPGEVFYWPEGVDSYFICTANSEVKILSEEYDMFSEDPEKYLEITALFQRRLLRRIVNNVTLSSTQRLLKEVFEAVDSPDAMPSREYVEFPMSRSHTGALMWLSRKMAGKLMDGLVNDGVLERGHNKTYMKLLVDTDREALLERYSYASNLMKARVL